MMDRKTEVLKGKDITTDNVTKILKAAYVACGTTAKVAADKVFGIMQEAERLTHVTLGVVTLDEAPALLANGHMNNLAVWGFTLEFLGAHPSEAAVRATFRSLGVEITKNAIKAGLYELGKEVERYEKALKHAEEIEARHAAVTVEVRHRVGTVSLDIFVGGSGAATIDVDDDGYWAYVNGSNDKFDTLADALNWVAGAAKKAGAELRKHATGMELLARHLDGFSSGKDN